MTGRAPNWVISFLLLAPCATFCQSSASTNLHQESQTASPNPPEVQRPETRSWQSLPDAPTPVQPSFQANSAPAEIGQANLTPPLEPGSTTTYQLRFTETQPHDPFANYLQFQLPKPDPAYAAGSSFLGRTSYAVSSTFLARSASGKPRLNTAYILGMLALAAVHTGYRPYWQRTGGAVAGDFGVTIGSSAGINVFHAFEPAILNKTRALTPKFLYKLQERFTGSQAPRDSLSTPGQ
ncbi:MAG: hypothetical protein WA532_08110 [Candidatus Korobacteraceae bacterium]